MDNSHFGRLSAELRNKIYELALTRNTWIFLEDISSANQLTKTCRQMRREAAIMFWASNRFWTRLSWLDNPSFDFDFDTHGWMTNVRPAEKVGRLLSLLGMDKVSSIKRLDITPASGISQLEIYGAQDDKVNLSQTRSSWDNVVTDVLSVDLWVSEYRPIVKALLDMGLEVRETRGLNEE